MMRLVALVFTVCICFCVVTESTSCPAKVDLAIGSYTRLWWLSSAAGEGLTFATLTESSFTVSSVIRNTTKTENPAYCDTGRVSALYCVNSGRNSNVSLINNEGVVTSLPTHADGSTHVAVLPARPDGHERLLIPNYGDGSVTSMMFSRAGALLSKSVYEVAPSLASFSEGQQKAPHPHHALPLSSTEALVADLGTDRVWHFNVRSNGALSVRDSVKMRLGDGPRHCVKGKNGSVYVVNEVSNTVARIAGCSSKLEICEHMALLNGRNKTVSGISSAAIRVSADGRFLYATSRMPNMEHGKIIAFKLGDRGAIDYRIGAWTTLGVWPRDFYIIENGPRCKSYIAVANRDSDNVVLLERNRQSGRLAYTAAFELQVRTPIAVLEVPRIPSHGDNL